MRLADWLWSFRGLGSRSSRSQRRLPRHVFRIAGLAEDLEPRTVPSGASIAGRGLVNDTGTPGDMMTNDLRISGALIVSEGSNAGLPVQYDINHDGIADGSLQSDAMGHFLFDFKTPGLMYGAYTVSVRGGVYEGGPMNISYGEWSDLTFSYIMPTMPTMPSVVGRRFGTGQRYWHAGRPHYWRSTD